MNSGRRLDSEVGDWMLGVGCGLGKKVQEFGGGRRLVAGRRKSGFFAEEGGGILGCSHTLSLVLSILKRW